MNALCSGSIYGGIPNNRVTGYAGDSGVGKTYFMLSAVKEFLQNTENEKGVVLYFDTEFALEKEMFRKRGIDTDRLYLLQPETLESFKSTCVKLLDGIEQSKDKRPIMFVLDSLGNLPTLKEVQDAREDKTVADMTRAKTIRSIFRILTLKLGKLGVPMLLSNHVYTAVGAYVPTKVSGGGGGVQYACSQIIMLSMKKDKDGNDVVGGLITAKMDKSRYSKKDQKVELRLNFDTGLDRFYGLLPIAEKHGLVTKVGNKYELPDGSKRFESWIEKNPDQVWTPEMLEKIDAACKEEFGLGNGESVDEENVELDEEE